MEEGVYTKLTALGNLIRPWVKNDKQLLRAIRGCLEVWEAEGFGEGPQMAGQYLVIADPAEPTGQRWVKLWPFVDEHGNIEEGWHWPVDLSHKGGE